MKKIALVAILLAVSTAACSAQESRQDVSLSGTALLELFMGSSTDVQVSANRAFGGMMSYRFMITPTSALEANYGVTYQNDIHYVISNTNHYDINTRTQEVTLGYVRSFVFKNWNPFVEAGLGGLIFLPIRNIGTTSLDVKQQMDPTAMYGAGFAYEISPSFDIRGEYRGLVTKVPDFGVPAMATNRWYNIFEPMLGVAYHF